MSSRRKLSPHEEAIEAMAAAWLAQRDEGLTVEEAAEFSKWRLADPRHAAAVERLEQTWRRLQPLREFRPQARQHPDRDLLAGAARPASIITFPRAAALAALAAAVAVGVFYFRPAPPSVSNPAASQTTLAPETYATTADGYQRVTLSDGSVLELNGNSEARVEMLPAVRQVQLVRGEGHFTVAKNKARPFIVHANGVDVRAVGTAFNVRLAGSGDVDVLVTEGRVHVERQAGGSAQATLPELGVGDRLLVQAASTAPAHAEKLSDDAMRLALAWQGPDLRFAETPLASVVAQFNERNRIKIELADASLAAEPIGGRFRPDGVETFVHLFEIDPHPKISVERVSPERIILHRVP